MSNNNLKALAFDYGASSGRAVLGTFDGNRIGMAEMHRYSNDPVRVNGRFHWDILRLFHEMKQGMVRTRLAGHTDIASIGVDTWGVDYGLIDSRNQLMQNPVHYRDSRTDGMMDKTFAQVPRRELYDRTGIQFMQFNTLFQLKAHLETAPWELENASRLLLMPDLFNWMLTGVESAEFSMASTTQMLNARTGQWDKALLEKLGIPTRLLPDVTLPGRILGNLLPEIQMETGLGPVPVVSVAGHDTGSAVAAVPATGERFAYISSGTWSLLGFESKTPVLGDTAFELDFTNEGGVNGTYRVLKNIMGLWILQECKRDWEAMGFKGSWPDLIAEAEREPAFRSVIDPDHISFLAPGGMPARIAAYCESTGQPVPESRGAMVRAIYESLALKYRKVLEGTERLSGYRFDALHVVGGGSQAGILCQFTANAIGRPVIAGPVEATALGNLAVQLMGLGEISGLSEAREIIRRSEKLTTYEPADTGAWDDAYGRFIKIIG